MTPSRVVAQAVLAAWLLGGAGCSLALKTDEDQCSVTADCTARGPTFAGTTCVAHVCVAPDLKWGCIGNVPPLMSGGMVMVEEQLADLITGNPVTTGLVIKLCSKYDPGCTMAVATPMPDATGTIRATVKSDFEGYFDITDPTGNYLEALVFLDVVVGSQNTDVLLVPKSAEAGLASNAGVTVDPTASLLLVRTTDCTGQRTAGVSVSMDPVGKETGFYVINSILETTATETDPAGNAGFVNVAPGNVDITGTVGPGGKEMGKVGTIVRGGTMTFQILRPTSTL